MSVFPYLKVHIELPVAQSEALDRLRSATLTVDAILPGPTPPLRGEAFGDRISVTRTRRFPSLVSTEFRGRFESRSDDSCALVGGISVLRSNLLILGFPVVAFVTAALFKSSVPLTASMAAAVAWWIRVPPSGYHTCSTEEAWLFAVLDAALSNAPIATALASTPPRRSILAPAVIAIAVVFACIVTVGHLLIAFGLAAALEAGSSNDASAANDHRLIIGQIAVVATLPVFLAIAKFLDDWDRRLVLFKIAPPPFAPSNDFALFTAIMRVFAIGAVLLTILIVAA